MARVRIGRGAVGRRESVTHVVDANVILRWLLNDHPTLSAEAAEFWAEVEAGRAKALLPEGVVVECVYVLTKSRQVPRAEVSSVIQRLVSMRGVSVESRKVMDLALRTFSSTALSFVDALVLAHAVCSRAAIKSFDQDLMKVARRSEAD